PRAVVGRAVDDDHAVETLAQEPHARVDLAQLFLAVDVFGVLGAVALRGSFRNGARDLRTEHPPQVVELVAKALSAGPRYVLRAGSLRAAVTRHGLSRWRAYGPQCVRRFTERCGRRT